MMMKKLSFAVALASVALWAGCATGGGGHTGHDIVVTVKTNPANQSIVGVTLTVQFTATVTNTDQTAVTWSVSGTDCTGNACGTIGSSSGLYTAPTSAPADGLVVKITATLTSSPTKTGTYNLTVLPIGVVLTPKLSNGDPLSVAHGVTQQFSAIATPDAAPQTVTWALVCDAGANLCGTLNQSGLYTAPNTIPSPATAHITATSTIDPTGNDTVDITIVRSRLVGSTTYAFRFSGFDGSGAIAVAGNFATNADGTAITGGFEDDLTINQHSTPTINSGNLALDTNSHGVLTLNTSAGTRKYNVALDADGDGRIIEFDSTGRHGSGQIAQATPNKFKNSVLLAGSSFAFGMTGVTPTGTQRAGFVGLFKPDGAGAVLSGKLDKNENGTAGSATDITGSYDIDGTADPHPGRGVLTLQSNSLGKTYHYAIYVIGGLTTKDNNPLTLFAISADDPLANPAVSGTIVFQDPSITYTNADFKDFWVANLTGVDGGGHSLVSLTNANGDGNGHLNGSYYANNGGVIPNNPVTITNLAYASTGGGRYTLDLLSPAVHFVLYSTAASRGFLLATSDAAVYTGTMDQQDATAFAPAEMAGSFAAATANSGTSAAGQAVMNLLFTSDLPDFTFGGKQDETDGGQTAGQTLAGTYTLMDIGSGTLVLTQPAAAHYAIFALDSSKQTSFMVQHFVMINVDPANTNPSIIFAER